MPRKPPTKRGLLAEARHVVLPDGIVSTGFPSVELTCRSIGIEFDEWQQDLNRCILGKDSSGWYAADTVCLSIPRQAGKTYDIGGLVFADSIINPGTTTVWTAHRFKVARESFNEMRAWARSPKLAAHIDYDDITTAAGNECIPFRNGSRILFAARERGAIRGFTKVRRIVLDEAQILTSNALADMAPTQNQAENPQIILMGTPPKPTDPAEVFTEMRSEALEGISSGIVYVEFSADPEADPDDKTAWKVANPSYPKRTSTKAIQRLRKLLTLEDFRREALGIWDSDNPGSVFELDEWMTLVGVEDARPDPVALAVEVSPNRQWSMIGLAGRRSDELTHLQIVESHKGTGWVAARVAELVKSWHAEVVVDPAGPAGALIPDLAAAGVDARLVTGREYAQACGAVYDQIVDRKVRHQGEQLMNISIRAAGQQAYSKSGAWVWRSVESSTDISPLKAVTLAYQALVDPQEPKKQPGTFRGLRR
jgi:phage terminase large subunit-like protein